MWDKGVFDFAGTLRYLSEEINETLNEYKKAFKNGKDAR